jgi:hypothetical protein
MFTSKPKDKNKHMNPAIIFLLIITIIPLIAALISYYAKKENCRGNENLETDEKNK